MRTWQAGAAASLFPWYQEGVNRRAGWASQGERAGESRAGAWVHVLQATRASRCHAGLSPASGETVQGLQRPREDASLPPAPPPLFDGGFEVGSSAPHSPCLAFRVQQHPGSLRELISALHPAPQGSTRAISSALSPAWHESAWSPVRRGHAFPLKKT